MDDFRHEYKEKRKPDFWMVFLVIISICSLLLSTVAIVRSSKNNNVEQIANVPTASLEGGTTNTVASPAQSSADKNIGGGVSNVASLMHGKVASITTYGKTSGQMFGNIEYAAIGSGSGFVVSEKGYVVTNNHVIEGGSTFKVKLSDEQTYDAELVGRDKYSDLAVLKIISDNKFNPVTVGDSSKTQVGEIAIAIGSPLGEKLANSVTVGYISALDREINLDGNGTRMIQTDAAINPGNSGGPLVNENGQVIGINTAKPTAAGYDNYGNAISTDGIGFAIPISDAMPVINQIINTGKFQRPAIGASLYSIDEETSKRSNVPQGILIRSVTKNGPADKAGLKQNDIITQIDGQNITNTKELTGLLQNKKVGDQMEIKVVRNGSEKKISLKLGDINELESAQAKEENNDKNEKGNWFWPYKNN